MKKTTLASRLSVVFLCAALMAACSNNAAGTDTSTAATSTDSEAAAVELASFKMDDLITFDEDDRSTEWSTEDAVTIELNGTSAQINGAGAEAADGSVTITEPGTYVLSGTLNDGQIVVDTEEEALVHLVLNGVDITDSDSAPIYSKGAGKTVITLADGTENKVADGKTYSFEDETSDEPSAAVFAKNDLTINGTGSLSVTASYKDGITSKDDFKLVGGTITIDAADDGIVGRDRLAAEAGTVTIKAGGDGMKSTNDEDEDKGIIAISGGTFDIEAENDGIQSEKSLLIDGGTYTLATGGGSANAEVKTESDQGPGMGRMNGDGGMMRGDWNGESAPAAPSDTANGTDDTAGTANATSAKASSTVVTAAVTNMSGSTTTDAAASDAQDTISTETESTSAKGIKAGGDMIINGGTFTIDSADDAVHSNQNISISGGNIGIASGDDAVHADALLAISGGTIDITESYEGLEGADITISGGEAHVIASDDGVNASGTDAETTTDTTAGATEASSAAEAPAAPPEATTSASTEGTAQSTGTEDSQSSTANPSAPTDSGAANGNRPPGGFGGGGLEGNQNASLTISGGLLTVDAGGDGVDSNGAITMTGGTVIVNGPTNNGNGTLDYDSTFDMSGGYLIGAGTSGMAQAVSDDSGQLAIAMTYTDTQAAGTLVHLEDSEGNTIVTFEPSKDYQYVVISSPDLEKGKTYTLYSGGTSTDNVADGWYKNGNYEGGTEVVSFELGETATTWLNESGVTTGNTNGGFGGGRR
ncbi:carbohydrate-binding domain-containing protein [Neobacillus mesonae]|nr:carbohydrate-binding domain-containing protein [Neobacillus mesonae]